MRPFALGGATLFTAFVLAAPGSSALAAPDARLERSLRMLEPTARLEQICDYTALSNIRKEFKQYRPDRAVASAGTEPHIKGHSMVAKGAAFRSQGKWYAMSYSCVADPEHMKVLKFKYTVGEEIPASNWAAYNLFD